MSSINNNSDKNTIEPRDYEPWEYKRYMSKNGNTSYTWNMAKERHHENGTFVKESQRAGNRLVTKKISDEIYGQMMRQANFRSGYGQTGLFDTTHEEHATLLWYWGTKRQAESYDRVNFYHGRSGKCVFKLIRNNLREYAVHQCDEDTVCGPENLIFLLKCSAADGSQWELRNAEEVLDNDTPESCLAVSTSIPLNLMGNNTNSKTTLRKNAIDNCDNNALNSVNANTENSVTSCGDQVGNLIQNVNKSQDMINMVSGEINISQTQNNMVERNPNFSSKQMEIDDSENCNNHVQTIEAILENNNTRFENNDQIHEMNNIMNSNDSNVTNSSNIQMSHVTNANANSNSLSNNIYDIISKSSRTKSLFSRTHSSQSNHTSLPENSATSSKNAEVSDSIVATLTSHLNPTKNYLPEIKGKDIFSPVLFECGYDLSLNKANIDTTFVLSILAAFRELFVVNNLLSCKFSVYGMPNVRKMEAGSTELLHRNNNVQSEPFIGVRDHFRTNIDLWQEQTKENRLNQDFESLDESADREVSRLNRKKFADFVDEIYGVSVIQSGLSSLSNWTNYRESMIRSDEACELGGDVVDVAMPDATVDVDAVARRTVDTDVHMHSALEEEPDSSSSSRLPAAQRLSTETVPPFFDVSDTEDVVEGGERDVRPAKRPKYYEISREAGIVTHSAMPEAYTVPPVSFPAREADPAAAASSADSLEIMPRGSRAHYGAFTTDEIIERINSRRIVSEMSQTSNATNSARSLRRNLDEISSPASTLLHRGNVTADSDIDINSDLRVLENLREEALENLRGTSTSAQMLSDDSEIMAETQGDYSAEYGRLFERLLANTGRSSSFDTVRSSRGQSNWRLEQVERLQELREAAQRMVAETENPANLMSSDHFLELVSRGDVSFGGGSFVSSSNSHTSSLSSKLSKTKTQEDQINSEDEEQIGVVETNNSTTSSSSSTDAGVITTFNTTDEIHCRTDNLVRITSSSQICTESQITREQLQAHRPDPDTHNCLRRQASGSQNLIGLATQSSEQHDSTALPQELIESTTTTPSSSSISSSLVPGNICTNTSSSSATATVVATNSTHIARHMAATLSSRSKSKVQETLSNVIAGRIIAGRRTRNNISGTRNNVTRDTSTTTSQNYSVNSRQEISEAASPSTNSNSRRVQVQTDTTQNNATTNTTGDGGNGGERENNTTGTSCTVPAPIRPAQRGTRRVNRRASVLHITARSRNSV